MSTHAKLPKTVARGPYDELYRASAPAFLWGDAPGRLVARVSEWTDPCEVLDAGCGDGKNAAFLLKEGFSVDGFDVSEIAIKRLGVRLRPFGRAAVSRFRTESLEGFLCRGSASTYGVVVSYGLLHCLPEVTRVEQHRWLLERVRPGGLVLFSALTDDVPLPRRHGTGHIRLVGHSELSSLFSDAWQLLDMEEGPIHERHLPLVDWHSHSAVWIAARRGAGA